MADKTADKTKAVIETGKVKLPVMTKYVNTTKDILDILNLNDFPQFTFRWVREDQFGEHKQRGWEFVSPEMGVETRYGKENVHNRIQLRELTLMFHWQEYIDDRNKKIKEKTDKRVSNIDKAEKIRQELSKD